MLSIFKDERREIAAFETNPWGTGRFLSCAASRSSCVAPPHGVERS